MFKKYIKKIKCILNHDYQKWGTSDSVKRCIVCEKFKVGPAIDADGCEMFVFSDGSVMKLIPQNK